MATASRNILHLDLKPENILISKDDVPWISDFGLSKKQCLLGQQKENEGQYNIKRQNFSNRSAWVEQTIQKQLMFTVFGILS